MRGNSICYHITTWYSQFSSQEYIPFLPNLEPDSVESSSQTISQIEANQDDETGESSNEYEVTSKWPEFQFLEPDTIVGDTQTIERY